ncbi:MAG: hypothetical protein WA160_08165 [Pseudobdellovibrio sp.]
MSKDFKQSFYNPVCLCCGSFFSKEHLFCIDCYQGKIISRLEMKVQTLSLGLQAHYLIEWVPFESDLISEMVYRFKSDKCIKAWRHYAELITEELERIMDTRDIKYIIPVPGSKKNSIHANVFSQFLSQFLRKPVVDILEKKKQTVDIVIEQKKKSKLERLKTTIQLREQFTSEIERLGLNKSHVLIVDDIVTTGSSFKQSTEALGPIQKATYLAMFYRT